MKNLQFLNSSHGVGVHTKHLWGSCPLATSGFSFLQKLRWSWVLNITHSRRPGRTTLGEDSMLGRSKARPTPPRVVTCHQVLYMEIEREGSDWTHALCHRLWSRVLRRWLAKRWCLHPRVQVTHVCHAHHGCDLAPLCGSDSNKMRSLGA